MNVAGRYDETANSGVLPIAAIPIEIIVALLESPRSGHLSGYSGQRTASVPPKDSCLYKISSTCWHTSKPQGQ